jgi:hypothetical protein
VFVALGIQQAMGMRDTVICGLPTFAVLFPHYLINGMIFEKKEHKMWFRFSVKPLSEIFFILRITEVNTIKNVLWSSGKVFVILVQF